MTVPAYALLLATVVALAFVADQVWMRWIHPWLERRHGWPPIRVDERIPAHAWAGGLSVIWIILVGLPTVGVAAGY